MLAHVQYSCILLSYLAAFGGEIFQLLRQRTSWTRGWLIVFAAAGMVAHTAYLINRSSVSGLPPLVGSSHDWLLVFAWLAAFIYLLVVVASARAAVSLFVLPTLIALVTIAAFVDDSSQMTDRETAVYWWSITHASTLVIGLASMAAATVCALMYLIQYQKLRGRNSWLHRLQLPNLEQLTEVNRRLVLGTVVMLTVGLFTGLVLKTAGPNSRVISWSDPIVAATTIAWILMVVYLLWLLVQKEQTGRQVARLTFVTGIFVLFSLLGLVVVSGGVHGSPEQVALIVRDSTGSLS